MNALKKLFNWMRVQVHSPYASFILALLFFIEAIFYVPAGAVLLFYCLERRLLAWRYALIATCASVMGGIGGYGIGYVTQVYVGEWLIAWFFSPQQFLKIVSLYKKYESVAILIAAFTPIPYKIITLSAGFCKLPLLPFILCSFISRGARLFLVAGIVARWGDKIKLYIDRYFTILVLLFTVVVGGAVWFII